MSREGSGNTSSGWSITKFVIALTGLIMAVAGLYAVVGNSFAPDPTPPSRQEVAPAGEVDRQPDPQPIRTTAPSRDSMTRDIEQLQVETIEALIAGDQLEANGLLEETETLIDDAFDRWPEDVEFMNLRGYQYKNMAVAFQRLKMEPEEEEYLVDAEKWFQLVHTVDGEDAAAWNGLGSIYLMRCEVDQGKAFIKTALEFDPGYEQAVRDLEKVPDFRAWCNR